MLQYEAPQSFWPEEPSHQEPEPAGPLAGPNVMNVVLVGAECAPWSKTGLSAQPEPSSSVIWVFKILPTLFVVPATLLLYFDVLRLSSRLTPTFEL